MIALSHYQINPLIEAWHRGERQAAISPDLNRTTVEITMTDEGVVFPGGELLTWEQVNAISDDENGCFRLEPEGELTKIQGFSRTTRRHVSLYPTPNAPTMLLSGFPMHRIKNTDPWQDTIAKVRAARPTGRVLDTTMGLGYTAIEASRFADHITTIELDPMVVEVARQNPWSQPLFESGKIDRQVGDSSELIQSFEPESFRVIIHDPPTFKLAGELYSGAFYEACFRALGRGGRLFHYIGDLESQYAQRVLTGVIRRLRYAGFERVDKQPSAFALVAYKR